MLLAIDIGNTNISFGVFEGEKLKINWQLSTSQQRSIDEYALQILPFLSRCGEDIKGVAICSVVPPLSRAFKELCSSYLNLSPLIVGPGIKTGVNVLVDHPKDVGADRVVNAAAAYKLYGGPAIVVDLGTAITFDAVSKDGGYLGGAIAPGLGIAAQALYLKTAKLPLVELSPPKQVIGKDTVSAMQSGLIFGFACLIEGMISKMKGELGKDAYTIATGGDAELIVPLIPSIQFINPHLTLIGLRIIYELNTKEN